VLPDALDSARQAVDAVFAPGEALVAAPLTVRSDDAAPAQAVRAGVAEASATSIDLGWVGVLAQLQGPRVSQDREGRRLGRLRNVSPR
jgi:hypothetical protein